MNNVEIPSRKQKLKWQESDLEPFGKTLEEIQAEFKAKGLESKGSSFIEDNKVKIGRKLKYICKTKGCSFAARIIIMESPPTLKLEVANEHNHSITRDDYCRKKLVLAVKKKPSARPKDLLKEIRREEPNNLNNSVPDSNQHSDNEEEKAERVENDEEKKHERNGMKTDKQILQAIRSIKSANNNKGEIICVNDFKKFFEDNKLANRTNNEVFVCDALLGDGKSNPISLVFSSKTCMRFLHSALSSESPVLALDGTFKVNNLGHPLICLTTQDANHEIFPIAFAPSSSECEETISFILDAVSRAYNLLYKRNLKIRYFMSDCAAFIFSSVSKVLGPLDGGHLSCYFHIKEAQRKKNLAEHKVNKADRNLILEHLDVMHSMFTKQHFEKYWTLFKEKHVNYESYNEYFERTYIQSQLNKWHFYDVRPNVFLTNNICESLNAKIKRDWTNRERQPLHIFFNKLKEGIIDLSRENKRFQNDVETTTEIRIKASQLDAKKIFLQNQEYYFLDKLEETKPDVAKVDRLLNLNYTSLDDFKNDYMSLIILKWEANSKVATCFCNMGFKYGVCRHKLALEILQGISPRIVMLLPKKKRGRKRKAPLALEKEEDDIPNDKRSND